MIKITKKNKKQVKFTLKTKKSLYRRMNEAYMAFMARIEELTENL